MDQARFALADLPCVGRREEQRLILADLKAAENQRGSYWLITGPAGIGKSRLLRQIARLAETRGFQVRRGHGVEHSVAPLLPFYWILSDDEHHRSVRAADTASSFRREYRRPHAATLDLEIMQVIDALEYAARERPQLILLDNLEWADRETLRCLKLVSRLVSNRAIVVLAAARVNPESWETERFGRALVDMRREGFVRWHELLPLEIDDRLLLAAHLLGRSPAMVRASPELCELVEVAGGLPYDVIELVGAWADAEQRRSAGPKGGAAIAPSTLGLPLPSLPSPVVLATRSRLGGLASADRAIVGLAAQIGPEFDVEPVSAALHQPPRLVRARLGAMARWGWPISEVSGGHRDFAFDHELLRSVIRTSPAFLPRRTALRRLVRWWSGHRTDDPVTEGRIRGLLNDRAGSTRCLRRSIDLLLRRGAFAEVVGLLSDEDSPFVGSRTTASARLALGLETASQLRERLQFYWAAKLLETQPLERLPPRPRWMASCWVVEGLFSTNLAEADRRLVGLGGRAGEGGLAGAPDGPGWLAYLKALSHLHHDAAHATLHDELNSAAELLRDGHHEFERCRLLALDVTVLANESRWHNAKAAVREARRVLTSNVAGRDSLRTMVREAESHLAYRRGSVRRALAIERALLGEMHRSGDVTRGARVEFKLAAYELGLRRTAAARAHAERAEAIYARLGGPAYLQALRTLRGWTWIVDGEWDAAEEAFRAVRQRETATDWGASRWAAAVGLALIDAERGNPRRALRNLPPRDNEPGRSTNYLTEYYCTRARILELCGEAEAARTVLREAVRKIPAPLTDRMELFAQLVRWEHLYGTRPAEEKWSACFRAIPIGLRSVVPVPWEGIGFAGVTPPSSSMTHRKGPQLVTNVEPPIPLGERLLSLLRQGEGHPEMGVRPGRFEGLTEAEIARLLRLPRERFSRALRRLWADGRVDRTTRRRPGTPRRVFVYRTTNVGRDRAPNSRYITPYEVEDAR